MSDVILYPIRGQVAQVNGKNEYIVYVPRADKYTYGTVKIGSGLVSEDGVVSIDRSEITIKEIQKNGVKIEPVDKVVNLVLTKAEFGLDNVDNTSDLDKPLSKAAKAAYVTLEAKITESAATANSNLEAYKVVVNGQIQDATDEADRKIVALTSTVTQNKNSADAEFLRLNNLIKGKEESVAFASYAAVFDAFNSAPAGKYNVGQSVYIQNKNVPDLWVYSVESSQVDGGYTSDEDVIRTLELIGSIRVGYYRLAMMETKTADISNAVTLDSVQTITGTKIFTEQIGILNGDEGEINYLKHINNNFLISTSDGDNILNIDEQLRKMYFYYEPVATETYVDENFISFNSRQSLTDEQKQIARENIGAGTGSGSGGGTLVLVGGEQQTTWDADSKLDVQRATSTGNTELRYSNGLYVYTTGDNAFRYNGNEVATLKDIEDSVTSVLTTEV